MTLLFDQPMPEGYRLFLLPIAQPEGNGEQDGAPAATDAQDAGGQDAPSAEQSESNGKSRKKTKKVAV